MSSHTDNLKLFKYDPETDGASTFSLKTALNDNWDKLDAAVAGKADLDPSGKISAAQLPTMNYDPAGSAAAVQASVDAHTGSKDNPHGVTAAQVGAAATAELNAHTANRSNPHGVTAAQVGAMPVAGGAFAGHVSMPSLTLTNYGVPLEIGQMLDFHFPGSVADYNGRLYLGADGHLYWGSTPLSLPDAQKSVAYAASAGNANTLGGLPASNFYTAANAPVVVGTYTGDGAKERRINLGFTPRAVLVMHKGVISGQDPTIAYGGLAVAGSPACVDPRYGNYSVLVDTYGFVVYNSEASGGSARANLNVHYYNYIAFR